MKDEINNEIIDMMSRLFRTMKHSMSFNSKHSHVTMLQFEALWCIKKSKHAQMSDIAENFSITMPTATSLVNKLITTKLANRENDKKDRRIVRITLTRQGEKLLDEIAKQRNNRIHELLSYLSTQDKKDFFRILKTIVKKSESYEK